MAGKLYLKYDPYATSDNTFMAIAPETKLARAYAEGYAGRPAQLTGDPATLAAYNFGVTDKAASKPPGHCAG